MRELAGKRKFEPVLGTCAKPEIDNPERRNENGKAEQEKINKKFCSHCDNDVHDQDIIAHHHAFYLIENKF